MKSLQPKLRFYEFKDEWFYTELQRLSNKIGDGLHGTPEYVDNSDIVFINGNNLIDGRIKFFESSKKVNINTFKKNDKNLNHNSILISLNGTIGSVAKYNGEKVMLSKSVGYINFTENAELFFHLLRTNKIQRLFESNLTGSTIKNLSLKTLRETKIIIPPSKEEQTKIANFLTSVDEKINLLIEKKEALEEYKKGMMQKIFSQEIRFKADNGEDFEDWEEKRLGEICEINKGSQLNRDLLNEKDLFPCISGGIEPSGFTNEYNRQENTIIISEGGNSCGFVNFITTKFWCGGHCYSIELINNELDKNYLFQILKFNQDEIMKLRVGSGLPNIQKKDLLKFEMKISNNLNEQTKIASFLSAIDDKIDLVFQLIEETKEYKKGLLQGMFC